MEKSEFRLKIEPSELPGIKDLDLKPSGNIRLISINQDSPKDSYCITEWNSNHAVISQGKLIRSFISEESKKIFKELDIWHNDICYSSGYYWIMIYQDGSIIRIDPHTSESKVFPLKVNGWETGKSMKSFLDGNFIVACSSKVIHFMGIDEKKELKEILQFPTQEQIWAICVSGEKNNIILTALVNLDVVVYETKKLKKGSLSVKKIMYIKFSKLWKFNGFKSLKELLVCPKSRIIIVQQSDLFGIYTVDLKKRKLLSRNNIILSEINLKNPGTERNVFSCGNCFGYFDGKLLMNWMTENDEESEYILYSFDAQRRELIEVNGIKGCGRVLKILNYGDDLIGVGKTGIFVVKLTRS